MPSEELMEFVNKLDAPVTDSLMGKGAFPGTDPRYTGMLGMHGTKTSNYGVSECDLLVVLEQDSVTGLRVIQRPLPRMPRSFRSILMRRRSIKIYWYQKRLSAM